MTLLGWLLVFVLWWLGLWVAQKKRWVGAKPFLAYVSLTFALGVGFVVWVAIELLGGGHPVLAALWVAVVIWRWRAIWREGMESLAKEGKKSE